MPLRYLLDTNIVSNLITAPGGAVARRILSVGEACICTSIVVAAELRYGAQKAQSAQLRERVTKLLSALEVLPLDQPADDTYAVIRDRLTRKGKPIGPNDLLIAAQAIASDLTLVTSNVREFSRLSELRIENWLAPRT